MDLIHIIGDKDSDKLESFINYKYMYFGICDTTNAMLFGVFEK